MIPRVLLATLVVFATHPAFVYAGHCGQQVQRVVKQQAVVQYAAPVVAQQVYGHAYQQQVVLKQVAYPLYEYRVGANLQNEAQAELLARKALDLLEKKLEDQVARRNDRQPAGFTHPGQTVAQQKCATCHSAGSAATQKAESPAPVFFSGLGEWTGTQDQAVSAVNAAREGRMPPKGPEIDTDSYLALKSYLTEATSPIGK